MRASSSKIISLLPRILAASAEMREILVGNTVLFGEIPAPTGSEAERAHFFSHRLSESGLTDCFIDPLSNAIGILPGLEGKRTIAVIANGDTLVSHPGDQTVEVKPDTLVGPFVVDNSLALGALSALPELFSRLNIQPKASLLLMMTARSQGRGNLEGLKTFLSNTPVKPAAGVCLEGVQLGRLNYISLGMRRGEIVCRLPEDYDWAHHGNSGAIVPMSSIVTRISQIALPRNPLTSLVLGSIEGGISHHNIARKAVLRFELRGESADLLAKIEEQLEDITQEVSSSFGVRIKLDIFARREPGGLEIGHPFVRNAREILTALGLKPALYPTTSVMSALVALGIPALTLGLTTGERGNDLDEIDETAAIGPMITGLAQLAAVILDIDEELANA